MRGGEERLERQHTPLFRSVLVMTLIGVFMQVAEDNGRGVLDVVGNSDALRHTSLFQ